MNIININDNSNKLFYIGGIVRDTLLGRKAFDIDITYVGDAIEYCAKFGEVLKVNPDFGTIKVKVPANYLNITYYVMLNLIQHLSILFLLSAGLLRLSPRNDGKSEKDETSAIVDFASTRCEVYEKKGHLPVITKIGCSLKDDVMRRDFTVNALAKSVTTDEIVDYAGGLEDLKNKKLRVLHDMSFVDDPTRIIRGLKFSVRFGFELEEHTRKLQDEYLANINYDMSFKRVKKELIETFNLNSQKAFEKFINEKIYKLVTPNEVELPKVNIENLVNKYLFCHSELDSESDLKFWLVYVGILVDLSRLPLTKAEQKILDDVPDKVLDTDYELYKAFENASVESVLLYAILRDEKGACHYLDNLKSIKIETNGKDLQQIGVKPSPKYSEIFDEVLKEKLKNPQMTKQDEMNFVANFIK